MFVLFRDVVGFCRELNNRRWIGSRLIVDGLEYKLRDVGDVLVDAESIYVGMRRSGEDA